ncbi:MAG: endonuclease III [Chloroflexi bacterium]|nr:MAG: endonuclease III [Chloroflexota bacterium]
MSLQSEPATQLTSESPAEMRLPEIVRRLREVHPDAKCALDHTNPLQLLVATILSAQCTDERVNQVTPALFEKYPTAAAFASADRAELEEAIRPTGFYRQKARYIQEACQIIAHEYDGQVPADMESLLKLPGVARKTANVVLGVAFEIADGIVVDTHVKRLAQRLALTQETSPEKIERDLMALVPREDWIDLAHLLIFHGRRVCQARKPDCSNCVLSDLCPSAGL